MLLGEGLQVLGRLETLLSDFLRHDDPEDARIVGAGDRGVSLSEHAVSDLLEIPRGASLRVRDDHGLVDEDRDPERVEIPCADVQVSVDVRFDDGRGVVVAAQELAGIGHASIRIADPHHVALLLEPFPDLREPVAGTAPGARGAPALNPGIRRGVAMHSAPAPAPRRTDSTSVTGAGRGRGLPAKGLSTAPTA